MATAISLRAHSLDKVFFLPSKFRCQASSLAKYFNNKFLNNKNQAYYTLSS